MFEEIELKLAVMPEGAKALAAHPLLRVLPARTNRVHSIYIDTPDQLIRRNGMALRLRRVGQRWVQTLKVEKPGSGALSTRTEWESPIVARRGQPTIDLVALGESPLPPLLEGLDAHKALRPVFITRFSRTAWTIKFRKSLIEIAIDIGDIRKPNSRSGHAPIHEVELELKNGRPRDLVDLALTLGGRGASTIALLGLATGKAERGYRLLEPDRPRFVKASAGTITKMIDRDMSASSALREVARRALEVVMLNADALRERYEPECVHQARVAIRRLRSAIRLLDPRGKRFPELLINDLRWLARELGLARDWDVLTAETIPVLVDTTDAQTLLERALKRRHAARERLVAQLSSIRFGRAVLRLQRWILDEDDGGKPLRGIAKPALTRAHTRLLDAARFFAALTPERRHRVRILAKRLRYSLDILSIALPDRSTSDYGDRLAQLQDLLGEINDFEVAALALRRVSRSPARLAPLQRRVAASVRERLIPAEECLASLATEVPWEKRANSEQSSAVTLQHTAA